MTAQTLQNDMAPVLTQTETGTAAALSSAFSAVKSRSRSTAIIVLQVASCQTPVSGQSTAHSLIQLITHQAGLALRQGDIAHALSPDELVVILRSAETMSQVTGRVEALLDRCQDVLIDQECIALEPRVGVARFPADGETLTTLIEHARFALPQPGVKCAYRFFSSQELKAWERDQARGGALRDALVRNKFTSTRVMRRRRGSSRAEILEFQLGLDHAEGSLDGVELQKVAEGQGLLARIEHHAIRAACHYIAENQEAPEAPSRVSVKVSSATLSQKNFVDLMADAATSAGVRPERLELEIEERHLASLKDFEPTLLRLRKIGIAIAIGDFGTGVTSLSGLSHLSVSTLKIDESIVRRMPNDAHAMNHVRAIIDLGKRLGMCVVAAKVGCPQTEAFLTRAGCLTLQTAVQQR